MERKTIHSVTLDTDKCRGCVSCMRRCPTEAIRVRNKKAKVLYDRCIGCGECVRVCPHHAKIPAFDSFDMIHKYKYKVAIVAPSFYGQFKSQYDINLILNGLLAVGFDDVEEVAKAAELVSEATREWMKNTQDIKHPIINTACPTIVELILVRFHGLIDNLLPLQTPADVAIKLAYKKAKEKGYKDEEIGIFFISPCPAKVLALKNGIGIKSPLVTGVLSMAEVYYKVVTALSQIKEVKPLNKAGFLGVAWASSGGEALGVNKEKYLEASGIENVIAVLKEIENGKLENLDFVELNACTGGCVGGVLTVENPFVAKAKIREFGKKIPCIGSTNTIKNAGLTYKDFDWEVVPTINDVFKLDENRIKAMQKLEQIESIYAKLPHFDCGVCGAPSCKAFAEDVVIEGFSIDDCTRMDERTTE
ncbi:MAG TPA: 4Fe-4S binding protein [Clostridiales bacterium]|nr:4Fe-4S binding protein [Clostridiales bacterium]